MLVDSGMGMAVSSLARGTTLTPLREGRAARLRRPGTVAVVENQPKPQ